MEERSVVHPMSRPQSGVTGGSPALPCPALRRGDRALSGRCNSTGVAGVFFRVLVRIIFLKDLAVITVTSSAANS